MTDQVSVEKKISFDIRQKVDFFAQQTEASNSQLFATSPLDMHH